MYFSTKMFSSLADCFAEKIITCSSIFNLCGVFIFSDIKKNSHHNSSVISVILGQHGKTVYIILPLYICIMEKSML